MKTKITLIAFLASIFIVGASAGVVTWTGPATGDWATASNWTPAVPTATDSVSVPAGFTVTIASNAGTINRLSVSGKLIIAASGSLNVEQTVSVNNGAIVNLAGGELVNDGTFQVKNSVTTSSNTVIKFSESTSENKLTNNGTFSLDNTSGAYASTTGRAIGLSQISNISTFKMGGTMNFAIKSGCCMIETDGGGNLTVDGTVVIGSTSDYRDMRFMKIQLGGSITIAPTANITVYSGFTNASNGVVNLQTASTTAPGSSFTNNGTFVVHGGSASAGYGIYFNPQAANAINTLNNNGMLKFDGTFAKGTCYIGGNTAAINTINNAASATLGLYNPDPAMTVFKLAGSNPITLNNNGVINLSTSTFTFPSAVTVNNTGTINYGAVSGLSKLMQLDGKLYTNGKRLIVHLTNGNGAQLQLVDVTGRVVNRFVLQQDEQEFSLSGLKGVYIVRLVTGKGLFAQKISVP